MSMVKVSGNITPSSVSIRYLLDGLDQSQLKVQQKQISYQGERS